MKLYRFIDLPEFINLIECKQERFDSINKWEDTYEGFLLKQFSRIEEDGNEVIDYIINIVQVTALKGSRRKD